MISLRPERGKIGWKMIADYNFYIENYRGRSLIEPKIFSFFSERASDELSRFEKVVGKTENAQIALKKCCCAIADLLYSVDNQKDENGKVVTSESVNGYYTASYNVVSEADVRNEIRLTINKYLSPYVIRGVKVYR